MGKDIFGDSMENAYVVNISTSLHDRSYVGVLHCRTWELEEGPCLYVGSRQSGAIYEVEDPNDGVIEGVYTDYIVSEGFLDDFQFGLLDKEQCTSS